MEQKDVFHIHTIQPDFVLKTDSFCQRVLATYGISHFYSCKLNSTEENNMLFIPDGCSNILFSYSNNVMKADVLGPTVSTKPFTLKKGTDYFGVRFQPGENPCFSNLTAKELVNDSTSLNDFKEMNQLREKMSEQDTFTTRMCTFLEEYRTFLSRTESTQHSLFKQISKIIVDKNGMVRISELEKLTGYSSRYLNYIFSNEAGMSAKQYCNITKLQTIINILDCGKTTNFSKLAEDFHFYDQSHFIHEFEDFTGTKPSAYLNKVIDKKYRQCVIDC